jgi:L-fuconolactonase
MMNRRAFIATAAAAAASASAQTLPLTIDSHVHAFKRDPAFPFAAGARPPADDASVEMLLDLMKANGVARTVIIQVIHYKWDNSYLADILKRHPKTFHGVARVNPEDPNAPDHVSKLTEQGFRGVRISPSANADGNWIKGDLMRPLWKRCAELKVPMTVLTPVVRMPDLVPLIERNPELTVVIDHMADSPLADPAKLDLLLALQRYPKVYVKISHMWSISKQPYPYPDAKDQVKRLHDRFGAKRLMWGTDWPVSLKELTYAQAVELFRKNLDFLNSADLAQILGKTVQEVWPFGL